MNAEFQEIWILPRHGYIWVAHHSLMKRLAFFQEGAAHISKEERKGKGKLYPKDITRFIRHLPNFKDAYICHNPKNHSVKLRKDVKWFQLKDIEFSNMGYNVGTNMPQVLKLIIKMYRKISNQLSQG